MCYHLFKPGCVKKGERIELIRTFQSFELLSPETEDEERRRGRERFGNERGRIPTVGTSSRETRREFRDDGIPSTTEDRQSVPVRPAWHVGRTFGPSQEIKP